MSIAPIFKTVDVAVPPARAFTAFTRDLGRWWPRRHSIAARPQADAVLEPRVGGRWYEVDADGRATEWGRVLEWDPPRRVLLAWQIDASFQYDPDLVTEVEVRFEAADGGTRVTLEHRLLERLGPTARRAAEQLGGGWPTLLALFGAFAQTTKEADMSPITIHGIPGSPYVRAALLALEEKGAHDWRLAPLQFGGQRSPEHLARHPFGRMPVLEHGDFTLYETQAILRYLDRVLPGPALTPADPRAEARMNQVIGIVDSYLVAQLSAPISFQRVVAPRFGMPVDEARLQAALPDAKRCVAELARLLGDRPYIAGDAVSLADLMLAPQLGFLPLYAEGQALLDAHPRLAAYIPRMEARASLAATTIERLIARTRA